MNLGASGTRWAVAAPHAAASEAAATIFERGGNAIDAAIAAATTLAVVYPQMCGVGGDLFALVQHPEGDVVAVNSAGAAPAALDPAAVRALHATMPERGPFTIVVPGAVAGWEALHRTGAQLPWADLFADAIRSASDGAPVASDLADSLHEGAEMLIADPGAREVFAPGGSVLEAGALLRQPALSATLGAVAAGGAAALYRGTVGEALVQGLRAASVPLSLDDLTRHDAEIVAPLIARWQGYDVRSNPPTSQGVTFLEGLLAIERLGIDPDPFGADAGTLALVWAAAARDREAHLGDPARMRVHPATLLDDGHIAAVCDEVRDGLRAAPRPAGRDTVGLVTADAQGWAVSLIQSLSWGFGSGILEPATGILLQNRGSGFTLGDPGRPSALAAGVRPPHTLMPVMAHRDGRPVAISGTMGGPAHPQINAASLARSLVLGLAPAEAVALPRWIVWGEATADAVVTVERGVPDIVREAIEGTGFATADLPADDYTAGHAQLIRILDDGRIDAGADPRADGAALAS